jgi:hypothetical protein
VAPARRVVVALLLLAGCRRAPSREVAHAALVSSPLSNDSSTVFVRVWQDGPPWFSCAEVIAKLDGHADTAAVRDQVGNWHSLVLSGWLVLRDTSAGVVSDPGWCAAKLTDAGALNERGWIPVERDSFPTGRPRLGWTVPIGHRRLTVTERPTLMDRDTARVTYAVSIAVNPNGAAMHADRDSSRRTALLVRFDVGWRVIRVMP